MKMLYLLVNFFTILVPFVFSFHPRIRFHLTWKAFFPAACLVGLVFVIWDAIFTAMGVWSFNPRYLLEIYLLGLPLEELLFFLCIPFSCVFTYFCLDKFYDLKWNPRVEAVFCIAFAVLLLVIGTWFYDRIYTLITMYSTALVCLYLKFVARTDWFGKASLVYGILLLPFLVVNGILTGTGIEGAVVQYNPEDQIGFRILTIPVEDAVYGFELFLLNLYFYKKFQRSFTKKANL